MFQLLFLRQKPGKETRADVLGGYHLQCEPRVQLGVATRAGLIRLNGWGTVFTGVLGRTGAF